MFTECQQNAKQHEIHKSDPGLQSLGREDGTRREGRGARWNCGTHAGGQGKGQPLGTEGTWMQIPDRAQGNWRSAGWVSKCEADPENWSKQEALSRHTTCPFLGIDRPEFVKAVTE